MTVPLATVPNASALPGPEDIERPNPEDLPTPDPGDVPDLPEIEIGDEELIQAHTDNCVIDCEPNNSCGDGPNLGWIKSVTGHGYLDPDGALDEWRDSEPAVEDDPPGEDNWDWIHLPILRGERLTVTSGEADVTFYIADENCNTIQNGGSWRATYTGIVHVGFTPNIQNGYVYYDPSITVEQDDARNRQDAGDVRSNAMHLTSYAHCARDVSPAPEEDACTVPEGTPPSLPASEWDKCVSVYCSSPYALSDVNPVEYPLHFTSAVEHKRLPTGDGADWFVAYIDTGFLSVTLDGDCSMGLGTDLDLTVIIEGPGPVDDEVHDSTQAGCDKSFTDILVPAPTRVFVSVETQGQGATGYAVTLTHTSPADMGEEQVNNLLDEVEKLHGELMDLLNRVRELDVPCDESREDCVRTVCNQLGILPHDCKVKTPYGPGNLVEA